MKRSLKTSMGLVLLSALLTASVTVLAQGTYRQYLPSVQYNLATAQPTSNPRTTPTATGNGTPTRTPQPTATPRPAPACAAALNASAFSGSFSFTFSDLAGAIKVERSTNGTLRFADPISSTNDLGEILSVTWSAEFSSLTSNVNDINLSGRSFSGGPHTTRSSGYLTIDALDCKWSMSLTPNITQLQTSSDGTVSGPDQVFELKYSGTQLSQTNRVMSNAQIDAFCRDVPAAGQVMQFVGLGTIVVDGPISNDSACDLYTAQGGAGLRGKLIKKATLAVDLAPAP